MVTSTPDMVVTLRNVLPRTQPTKTPTAPMSFTEPEARALLRQQILWPRQIFLTSNGRIVGKLCLSTSTCRLPWPLHRYLSSRGQGACESSAAFSNFFSRTNGEVTKGNRVPIRERQTLHSLEMPSQTRCCHGSISPWRLLRTLIASKYAPFNAPRKRAGRLFFRSYPLAHSVTGKR